MERCYLKVWGEEKPPPHTIKPRAECERAAAASCAASVAGRSKKAAGGLSGGELVCSASQAGSALEKFVRMRLASGSQEKQSVLLDDVEAHTGVLWCQFRSRNDTTLWDSDDQTEYPDYQVSWACEAASERHKQQRPTKGSKKSAVTGLLLSRTRGMGYERL